MANDDHKRMRFADLPPDSTMAMALEAMLMQVLLITVEKLGGQLVLTVDEVNSLPIGKRMDFEMDRVANAFTFTVKKADPR